MGDNFYIDTTGRNGTYLGRFGDIVAWKRIYLEIDRMVENGVAYYISTDWLADPFGSVGGQFVQTKANPASGADVITGRERCAFVDMCEVALL